MDVPHWIYWIIGKILLYFILKVTTYSQEKKNQRHYYANWSYLNGKFAIIV